jgi:ATP-dependent Clp protease ATP-binding subunit ClpC
VAAQILVESNLTMRKAEAAVSSRAGRGSGAAEGKLAFTPTAIAAFTGALASALEMGHNYIGTEHLLLGLARGAGLAAGILRDSGLTQETLAPKVAEKLAGYLRGRGAVGQSSPAKKASATGRKASRKAIPPTSAD